MSKFFHAPPKQVVTRTPNISPKIPEALPPGPKPRICIASPMHDNRIHGMTAMSVFNMVACGKFELGFLKVSSGGITKARNDLAYLFLKQGWEYLLWLDTDIQFSVAHVEKLIARNVSVVGAMYAHKKLDLGWSAHNLVNGPIVDELQEVAGLGMGLMLHRRKVYEDMMAKMPELAFRETWNEATNETKYGFYQERIVNDTEYGGSGPQGLGVWMTEDWFFSQNARKLGHKIYTDNSFYVNHWDGGQCFPNEATMDISATLIQYMQGLKDDGKLAREVMEKRLPGYMDQMGVARGRKPTEFIPASS